VGDSTRERCSVRQERSPPCWRGGDGPRQAAPEHSQLAALPQTQGRQQRGVPAMRPTVSWRRRCLLPVELPLRAELHRRLSALAVQSQGRCRSVAAPLNQRRDWPSLWHQRPRCRCEASTGRCSIPSASPRRRRQRRHSPPQDSHRQIRRRRSTAIATYSAAARQRHHARTCAGLQRLAACVRRPTRRCRCCGRPTPQMRARR